MSGYNLPTVGSSTTTHSRMQDTPVKSHPGFTAAAAGIAAKEGVSGNIARSILASSSRSASPAAKKANPRLNNVKG